MELNDEQFWQALRQALKAAEADEAAEMSAAERLLAETPVDDGAPLSDAHIDEVVRFATTPTAAEREAEAIDDAHAPATNGQVAPLAIVPAAAAAKRPSWKKRLLAGLPRPIAAAAALLLSVQFAAAAVVVTTVVVTAVVLQNTTQTLEYQDAVRLMMQDEQSEQARASSQVTLYNDLKDSIEVLQTVASESSAIAPTATAALDEVRRLLTSGGSFSPQHFADAHIELGDRVLDGSRDLADRQDALNLLAQQLNYGILAMKALELSSGPATLKRDNALLLGKLSEMLSR